MSGGTAQVDVLAATALPDWQRVSDASQTNETAVPARCRMKSRHAAISDTIPHRKPPIVAKPPCKSPTGDATSPSMVNTSDPESPGRVKLRSVDAAISCRGNNMLLRAVVIDTVQYGAESGTSSARVGVAAIGVTMWNKCAPALP